MLLITRKILIIKTYEDYRNCANEPYCFLTIDTALPADNRSRFRKNVFGFFIKMALDQVKILDDKTKANKAQYDLDRETAKIIKW